MSRRNPSFADVLAMLPWQVSATLAVIVFAALRWMIPAIEFENVLLKGFAKSAPGFSWPVFIFFGIIALYSAYLAAKKRDLLDRQSDLESLRALTWQEFEWMVGEAYRRQGYAVEESIAAGADGGIDLILRKDGETSLVQCKRWKTQSVGAPVIREMFGLMTHHQADRVMVVTSGNFTREAVAFAEGKAIVLIDGPALLTLVRKVQVSEGKPRQTIPPLPSRPETSENLPAAPPSGSSTPAASTSEVICPTCGAPMIKRVAKRGPNPGNTFWGCSQYPTCRGMRDA